MLRKTISIDINLLYLNKLFFELWKCYNIGMSDAIKTTLKTDWYSTEPIKVNDVCRFELWDQDYMCFKIIPYKQFEYLFLGSFDYKDTLLAIQTSMNGVKYAKVLTEKPQQEFALFLYKKLDK